MTSVYLSLMLHITHISLLINFKQLLNWTLNWLELNNDNKLLLELINRIGICHIDSIAFLFNTMKLLRDKSLLYKALYTDWIEKYTKKLQEQKSF